MGRGIAVFVLAFLLLVSFGSCRHEPTGDARYIPRFHFTVGADWTGEPVGLVYDEGVYHLFYQYNPSGSMFGDIHWGHAVSRDLFRWQIRSSRSTSTPTRSPGGIYSWRIARIKASRGAGMGKSPCPMPTDTLSGARVSLGIIPWERG